MICIGMIAIDSDEMQKINKQTTIRLKWYIICKLKKKNNSCHKSGT